ncbi:MAG: branched-chain amino acid ABC transporter substrate-binding protein [Anaerolineales bacterium]|jgi:branched-chain amino acid transport system substrate-binding protein
MSKKLALLSLLVIGTMVIAACGGSGPVTIKVATQTPLSGGQSAIGVDIKNGAQLALEQLSGPLTSMSFTVQMAPYDDQANPDIGVANAKQIVADPTVLCVVGHYNSGVQIPSSEEYHNAGLPNVSPANTNPKVTTRGYLEVNRIVGRDDVQGVVAADFAASKGVKSVYVLDDKTTYGEGIATFFQTEAKAKGLQVLGFEGTDEKANFDALLTPVLAANPDAIFFGGIYDQIAVFLKAAREKGFKGMLVSDDGFDSPEAAHIAGDSITSGTGTYYSTVAGPAKLYPGTAKFQVDFKARFGSDPKPFAAQGYDSMGICLQAILNAAKANGGKAPTRNAVALAVRALKDYAGITGTINFNSIGDLTKANYFVIHVVSSDPAQWDNNSVDETLSVAPPAPQ